MPSAAEYEAWNARKQQANVGKANVVLNQPFPTEPDAFAADLNLTREASSVLGRPVPSTMMADPVSKSVFEQIVAEKKRSTILSSSPRLTEWLRVPDNAAMSRDDLEGLSWWETAANAAGGALQRGGLRLDQSYQQWMAEGAQQRAGDVNKSFGDIYAQERANVGPIGNVLDNAVGPVTDAWNAGSRVLQAKLSDMFGGDQQAAAGYYQQQVGLIGQQIQAIPMSPAASEARAKIAALKPTGDLMGDVGQFLNTALADPAGFSAFLAETAAETAPSLVAAFGVGALTRNPAAFAATMGMSSAVQERYSAPADMMAERGLDITTPEGALAAISDPVLMKDAVDRGEIRGMIIGALDTISGGVAGETLANNPAVNLVLQSVLQAAFGGGGEAAGQVASGQKFNVSDVLVEALAEFVTAPIEVGGMAAERFSQGRVKAEAAAEVEPLLKEMSTAAANSVVRNRSPDTFRDYLKTALAGKNENLFVPADQFVQYFQSQGIDPFEVADTLSGMSREDVELASQTGGSVKIPTATWAADMAGGEHDQFIMENSAFSPDAFTTTEAAEFNAKAQDAMNEAFQEAEAARMDAEAHRQVYEIEQEQMIGYLRAAGRATDVATAEALPMIAFRRTMAERAGLTPEEFAARYPLPQVQAERPSGLDPKNVDALTRTLTEARNRRAVGLDRGQSLLEFISDRGGISDPGGELKARDASVIKRGRGKKTLRLERGAMAGVRDIFGGGGIARGMDDTARAAIEAGFMADDPDVLAYREAERTGGEAVDLQPALLRALDAELRGDAPVAADDLGGIEEYLAGLGVGLGDSDAAIRAAIEGGGEGRAYGQVAVPAEVSAFQRRLLDEANAIVSASSVAGKFTIDNALFVGSRAEGKGRADSDYDFVVKFTTDLNGPVVADLWDDLSKHFDTIKTVTVGGVEHPVDIFVTDEVYPNRPAVRLLFQKEPENPRWSGDGKDPTEWDGDTLSWKLNDTEKRWLATTDDADWFLNDAGELILGPSEVSDFSELVRENEAAQGRGSVPLRFRTYFQADAGFQGGGARGSIQFPGAGVSNGQTIISLFQSADLSTFLHETGHYFLTVTQDLARLDPSSPVAADLQAVKDWWRDNADAVARDAGNGVTADDVRLALDAGTTGDVAKDMAIDTGMQEQFARAVETYFLEGKAPSVALRSAFEKFSAWLLSIYRNLKGLNVKVTDDLRGVFDRMLATDDEIKAARLDIGADVALTAADLGMTDEQYQGFLKLRENAKADAVARTLHEAMKPIRRAATKAYKEERARVKADIERNLKAQPVYRAIQELRFGKDFDGNDVAPLKLNRALIDDNYGTGYVPHLPGATKDGSGHRNAVFSTEGGVHPDIAAGAYGFPTGRDMLDALVNAQPLDAMVEAETEKEMSFRHNDPLKDGSIEQAAMDATHADRQGQVLAAELQALNAVAGLNRGLSAKDARETARRSLRGMVVKDAIRADRFLAAERKAAQEVARLSATVTREGMWMDRARRRVETQARGAVRAADGAAALALAPKVEAANQNTTRFNEDAGKLIEAKRRQLLNHMLYAESRKVSANVETTIKRASSLNKADARLSKARNIDYVKAARAIASRFGLARPERGYDFAAWIEQLKFDDGVAADAMTDAIATYTQDPKHYRDLTVDELGAVQDAIDSILETGKRARLLEIDGQAVDKELAISELRDVLDNRSVTANVALSRKLNKWEHIRVKSLTILSALRRMENWTRDMDDGGQGPFTRYLVKPIMDALGTYRIDKAARLKTLLDIIEPNRADLLGKSVSAPELGYVFENKGELLHAILHTGNESNLEKLLMGRGWSGGLTGQTQRVTKAGKPSVDRQGNPLMTRGRVDTSKWDAMVTRLVADGTLTKADYDMAQAIWDLMDQMKRPAQSAHRRVYGFYFKEVEASAVETPFGVYRGGYVPAVADTDASNDGQIRADQAALEQQSTSFMFPTTGKGFTKSRVQAYNTPLALNLMLLPAHMDKVLRFTHLDPVVRQTASLVSNPELRAAIDAHDKSIIPVLITPWLQRTAQQSVDTAGGTTPDGRVAGGIWRELRKRSGLSTMFLNLVNTAQQVTGLSSALVLVKPGRMKSALVRFASGGGNEMRSEASEASTFMRDRIENAGREMQVRIQDAVVKPTTLGELQALADKHGYFLQQAAQNLVDVVAWHAAYDQAIGHDMTPDQAVFEADSVIRRTMGDFSPENISKFETGSPFVRLFTMFYSYFNGQANLVGGELQTAMRQTGWAGKKRMFFVYLYGIAIPAIAGQAISMAARGELGGDGSDDDGGWISDIGELFFGSQASYLTGMVPVAGPITQGILNSFNDKFYDDRLAISPTAQTVQTAIGGVRSVVGAATGGNVSKGVKDGLNTLGIILGLPTGQLAKSMGYLAGVGEGKNTPDGPLDLARGVVAGR